jgi:hypothetical protein
MPEGRVAQVGLIVHQYDSQPLERVAGLVHQFHNPEGLERRTA